MMQAMESEFAYLGIWLGVILTLYRSSILDIFECGLLY